jgi:hypothetical protein
MPRRLRLFLLPVVVPVWIAFILAGWAVTPHPMMRLFPQSAEQQSPEDRPSTGVAIGPLRADRAKPLIDRPRQSPIARVVDVGPASTGGSERREPTRPVFTLANADPMRLGRPAHIAGSENVDRPKPKTHNNPGQGVRAGATTPTRPDRPNDARDGAQDRGPEDRNWHARRQGAAGPG